MPDRPGTFAFGPFAVDPGTGEIRKSGRRIRLDDKAFQLLLALLERPGEVVSRPELIDRLWSDGVFVEYDKNLNNAVGRVREALGESAERPRFIETLPKRGYRFIATVVPAPPAATGAAGDGHPPVGADPMPPARDAPDGSPPLWSRNRASGIALAAVTLMLVAAGIWLLAGRDRSERIRSVVVLPFESVIMPTGEGSPHLAFGVTDALTTELSWIAGLRVVSSTSARWYKTTGKTLPEIARALGADAVIEGTVFQEGDQVQVSVQLVDASSDSQLWAEAYRRESGSLLALQREIAGAVAREIQLTLRPEQTDRPAVPATADPRAQDAYLRGRYHLSLGNEPGRQRALTFFQQAISLDPAHAASHVGLADVYLLTDALAPAVALPRAQRYARAAIELDESLAAAHATLGYIHYYGEWDWQAAERELTRAIELDPNDARALRWYARVIGAMGRLDESLTISRQAMSLDPVSIEVLDSAAAIAFRARQYDRTLEIARRIHELSPTDPRGFEHVATSSAQTGHYDRCLEAAARGAELSRNGPEFHAIEIACLGAMGRTPEARSRLRALETRAREQYVPPYFMAVAAIGAGRLDAGIDWLQRGFAERGPYLVELKTSPWLDRVRGDPRVQRIIEALRFPVTREEA